MTTIESAPRALTPLSDTTPVRPQRFLRLAQVELRKMLDTRAGLAVVLATLAVVLIATTWLIVDGANPSWMTFAQVLNVAGTLLPILGLLGMTSEWTQRTALTTFTAAPRRGRVLGAKVAASLALTAAVFVVMVGVVVAATAIAGSVSGEGADFGQFGSILQAYVIMTLGQTLLGIGLGALVGHTAFAIVLFFVAPSIVPLVGYQLFGENSAWFDVFQTYNRLGGTDPWSELPQTLVTLFLWVVVPFTVGVIRSMRREVK